MLELYKAYFMLRWSGFKLTFFDIKTSIPGYGIYKRYLNAFLSALLEDHTFHTRTWFEPRSSARWLSKTLSQSTVHPISMNKNMGKKQISFDSLGCWVNLKT
jgi:hypothetical protein